MATIISQTFDFVITKYKFRVINIGQIKLNHLLNFASYAEKFNDEYISIHLNKILDRIIIEGISAINLGGGVKYMHLNIPVLTKQNEHTNYKDHIKLVQVINKIHTNQEILLLYMCCENSDPEVNLNLRSMYILDNKKNANCDSKLKLLEDKFEILEQRINILEQENAKLHDIILLPKQMVLLEQSEEQMRKSILCEEDDELIKISKYYNKIQYFLSEQETRNKIMKEEIRQQLLNEMTIPSAPPE
jgi:hypothetical protein